MTDQERAAMLEDALRLNAEMSAANAAARQAWHEDRWEDAARWREESKRLVLAQIAILQTLDEEQ